MTARMIDAYKRHLVAAGYASTTTEDSGKLLRRVDAELPCGLPVATRSELVAWLAQPDWSAQTRKTYHDHLCRFYAWAADPADPWISYDPAAGLPTPRVPQRLPRPATDEQVRVCSRCDTMPWRLHTVLAAYAGLRPCEIARLQREHVDQAWVLVRLGKGRKDRRVPTHPRVWELVAPLPDGPLTHYPDGRRATPSWVSKRTAEHLHRRHHLPITLYNLRHWYGTCVQAGQGDIRVTQAAMGHSSPVTTAGYTEVSDARLLAAVLALPDLT